jgi:outer membrane protein OmpA-like peptidoglycan-associated protein
MNFRIAQTLILLFLSPLYSIAQEKTPNFEVFVFEENNRGYLNQVKVLIYQISNNRLVHELSSNENGLASASLDLGTQYRVQSKKDVFHERNDTIQIAEGKNYLKIEMKRKPGYIFDVTLAEVRESADQMVDAIAGARLEIYNNTKSKSELLVESLIGPYFQFTFEQGNHYTVLIRKDGYLAKRVEAHVNIDGCIICIDGINNLRPGVTDNLTSDQTMGTLLANIDLEKAGLDNKLPINDIYYEYNSADLTATAKVELDKVVKLMKANPNYYFNLGSHTDSRGKDEYNMELSVKRAQAAVAYIQSQDISPERITGSGHGETEPKNHCTNGVICSDAEHSQNRRTELTIVGVGNFEKTLISLPEMIRLERAEKLLLELQNAPEIRVPITVKEAEKPEKGED